MIALTIPASGRPAFGIAALAVVLAAGACLPDLGGVPPEVTHEDSGTGPADTAASDTGDSSLEVHDADDTDAVTLPDLAMDTTGPTVTPTWDTFARDFFAIYCNACHQTPPRHDAPFALDSYELVLLKLPGIEDRAIVKQDMPPLPPFPPQPDLIELVAWIQAGAPRN